MKMPKTTWRYVKAVKAADSLIFPIHPKTDRVLEDHSNTLPQKTHIDRILCVKNELVFNEMSHALFTDALLLPIAEEGYRIGSTIRNDDVVHLIRRHSLDIIIDELQDGVAFLIVLVIRTCHLSLPELAILDHLTVLGLEAADLVSIGVSSVFEELGESVVGHRVEHRIGLYR